MNWGRLFFGVVIISAGTILLLGNAAVIDTAKGFAVFWPSVIILAGLVSVLANRKHWVLGVVIMLVGTAFLLSNLDIINLANVIWPAIIIVIGLVIIFGRGGGGHGDVGDSLNSFHVFSGSTLTSRSTRFEGGSVSAVFGGAEIDLRKAQLAPNATLDIFMAFGGLEMKVPTGWNVVIRGFPIFGGFDNKTAGESLPDNAPTLVVNATVLFGGMEIKH